MQFDLTKYWYRHSLHPITFLLLPFTYLFAGITALRRWLYRSGILKSKRFSVPVIVVGNITAGGTGKTPFVIWLVKLLQANGYSPGVVSRGVGGKKHNKPFHVQKNSSAKDVGDEAILLARHCDCPVLIHPDRVAAVDQLLTQFHCDIVISDDGLQHYRLERDLEIVIVDGARRFGNQYLLPAGPLREPISRLQKVNYVVVNGGDSNDRWVMDLIPDQLISLVDAKKVDLTAFADRRVHAVAAIGNPNRFFLTLKNAGFDIISHAFPDHFHFRAYDLDFKDSLPILMTEKDAVKCGDFADQRYWYLSITAKIDKLEQEILSTLKRRGESPNAEEDFKKYSCR